MAWVVEEMPVKELLELPFNEYMEGCHAFVNRNDKLGICEDRTWLEAIWAKRYWFHKNGYGT